jgi:hypothetical protein
MTPKGDSAHRIAGPNRAPGSDVRIGANFDPLAVSQRYVWRHPHARSNVRQPSRGNVAVVVVVHQAEQLEPRPRVQQRNAKPERSVFLPRRDARRMRLGNTTHFAPFRQLLLCPRLSPNRRGICTDRRLAQGHDTQRLASTRHPLTLESRAGKAQTLAAGDLDFSRALTTA